MIDFKVGVPLPLVTLLEDGDTGQYPRAFIYVSGDTTPSYVIDLVHKDKGRYDGSFTPQIIGTFAVVYVTYSDSAHTVENTTYSREIEQLSVTTGTTEDLVTMVARLLGLTHENIFIDTTTFDAYSQLLSARVRLFDTKAHAEAATDGGSETTGLIASYTMTSTYGAAGRMGSYRMVKLP